uniref:Uncharacterized protein ycf18 n=1 Tax=Osmundea sinicola TaxID=290685 RepID=A0A7L4WNL0_9FLOR|nr:phycobilisome degradation protein [Osmundea sinicola]QFR99850.1 phycobilisome degradation protein [Osmundea sinicola]
MNNINKLTLEQEFRIKLYQDYVYKLSSKNLQKYLIQVLKIMIIKDNVIKYCIRTLIN